LSRQALLPSAEAALADAGRPADQKIGVVVDPLAFDQHGQQAAVEAARGAIVDVLDAGLLAQLGVLQSLGQPLVASQ
jgi:bacillopeptidase F (M6 metalloprotease family)